MRTASHPSSRRYSIAEVTRIRELRDAGWTLKEIQRLHERETGVRISTHTINRWTNPSEAAKHNARSRKWKRIKLNESITGRMPGANTRLSGDFKLIRAGALRDLGVPLPSIARMMNFDFREDITARQLERALETGEWPS